MAIAEKTVRKEGPCTSAVLRQRMMRRRSAVRADVEVVRPDLPPTVWLLHHSTKLSVVDRTADGLVWDIVDDDDEPGVGLPHAVARQLFNDERPEPIQLQQVTFESYRSLSDTSVDLAPFTLIVGPNGAGKSNLLDGLFRVLRLTEFARDSVFGGRNDITRVRTYGTTTPVGVTVRGADGQRLSWSCAPDQEPVFMVGDEQVDAPRNDPMARAFGPAVFLRLDPDLIGEPAYSQASVASVSARGEHVPVVLADLAATDPDRFSAIVQRVQEVLPAVEGLRMPRQRVPREGSDETVSGHALQAKVHGHWVPADQLSEGTRIVIALQTILGAAEPRPRVLLVDDLDRGLHPRAQQVLARQLQRETETGALQVVASTHSPFVLDVVQSECVQMVKMDDAGHTHVDSFDTLDGWEKWRDDMTAGEFWIHAGPDWAA